MWKSSSIVHLKLIISILIYGIRIKIFLSDGGSYKYNTEYELMKYFYGPASHNTIMLEDYDQMLKGPRFIWLNWTQAIYAGIKE